MSLMSCIQIAYLKYKIKNNQCFNNEEYKIDYITGKLFNLNNVHIGNTVDLCEHLKSSILRQRNFTIMWKATHRVQYYRVAKMKASRERIVTISGSTYPQCG